MNRHATISIRRAAAALGWVLAALAALGISAAAAAPARPFTHESFAQIRDRHAGRPLVVHLWGLTCGPCLVELPNWGELLRRRPGLPLVLIQLDPPPAGDGSRVLERAGLARAESWVAAAAIDEYLRAGIDPQWRGDMPRTLLIAPDGRLTRLRGVADLDAVARWLDASGAAK